MNLRVVTPRPFNASTPIPALAEDRTHPRLHYVRDHFDRPEAPADADAWRVRVRGLVARPLELGLAELRQFPSRAVDVTLECAGNSRTRLRPVPSGVGWDDGAVSTARWTGASLVEILMRAGVEPGAVEVVLRGADGDGETAYARSLPLDVAHHPDTLLAWEMDDAPIPLLHGGPLRLVVPGWYAMASVKWVTDVEVSDRPFEGRFQTGDYCYLDAEGRVLGPVTLARVKSLLYEPADGAQVPASREVKVHGRAWSGDAPVRRVDVSTDGGATWRRADLGPSLGPYAWRAFAFRWTPSPGAHVLVPRATDEAGHVQPLEPPWNLRGYGNNAVVPVRVTAK
ncbi:MAG TPA: sulfite oxidase [Candidatus Thermoplasmatota archaeon]|nr:sulfite oxidase [Candidatus Thermoplasmatota archaeon]